MATYVMMTRLRPESVTEPRDYEALGERVAAELKQECPNAHWLASYAILGPYDYLDIFEAPDNDTAAKVALIVRSFGHATTETWAATSWERFRRMIEEMHGVTVSR